ncbi:unnamed protein product, partial [Meganyctiphanes norvegica]
MSEIKITALSEPHDLGEGPIWIEKDKALMYVDAFQGIVHRHFPDTGRHQTLCIEKEAGFRCVSIVIPVEGEPDLYIVTVGRCVGTVRWPVSSADQLTVKANLLHVTDDHYPLNHFNDGKCDPRGRLWAGTKGHESSPGICEMERGTLFRLDSQLELTHSGVDKVSISNGMAWSEDRKTFYYIDSPLQLIYAFNYDDDEGKIMQYSIFEDFPNTNEISKFWQKMLSNSNKGGYFWCFIRLKQVICIDPRKEGDILCTIEMPCSNITSVTFGGPNYSTLYVTTAFRYLKDEERKATPEAGCTLAVTGLGVQGSPPISFKADSGKLKEKLNKN